MFCGSHERAFRRHGCGDIVLHLLVHRQNELSAWKEYFVVDDPGEAHELLVQMGITVAPQSVHEMSRKYEDALYVRDELLKPSDDTRPIRPPKANYSEDEANP